jgi:hypothetical protein
MKRCEAKQMLDVLSPIAVDGELYCPELLAMGGVATNAAIAATAQIDPVQRTVIMPRADYHYLTQRANGSKGDVDAYVNRVLELDKDSITEQDQNLIDRINEIRERLKHDLVPNIFGLKPPEEWSALADSPALSLIPRGGDRYKTPDGTIMKALHPWAVEIPEPEVWQYIFTESDDAPTITLQGQNPANDLVNRAGRTMIIRPRDVLKISKILDLMEREPALKAWLETGDGRSQFELARIALSVRANSWHPLTPSFLTPNRRREMNELSERMAGFFGPLLTPEELANHDAFLFKDKPDRVKHFLVGEAAAVKSPIYWLVETKFLKMYQTLNMENWPVINRVT